MWLLLTVIALISARNIKIAGPSDPSCPVTCFTDPANGNKYCYDLAPFQKPDNATAGFLKGKESGQSWTIYLNICGNAQSVGCGRPTPACQYDGGGNYFAVGSPQGWSVGPYYDPQLGPSSPVYGGGVAVKIDGGDMCGNMVARTTYLWLKCDPTVQTLPLQVDVEEVNPQTNQPTPCVYYFAPIPFAGFCPIGTNPPPATSNKALSVTLTLMQTTMLDLLTTTPLPFLNLGLACKVSGCQKIYQCNGTTTTSRWSNNVELVSLVAFKGTDGFGFSSSLQAVDCSKDKNVTWNTATVGPNSWWNGTPDSILTAQIRGQSVLSIVPLGVAACFSGCKRVW